MLKKIGTSVILWLHTLGALIYFIAVSKRLDPNRSNYNSNNWSTYYFTVTLLPLLLMCLLFAFTRERERSIHDRQFLLVEAIFCFSLILTVNLNNLKIISHTYGLIISMFGIIIATIIIVISMIRHGHFK